MQSIPQQGLYAITAQRHPDLRQLGREVRAALQGGAVMLQFRDKSGDDDWRLDAARYLAALCAEHGVPLIVNDDVALAQACGADGVHLGGTDMDLAQARALLGPDKIIGVSCYGDLERARAATNGGANYLAFGSVYASPTKPQAPVCPHALLGQAGQLGLPVVAIGGITPENGRALVDAGANLLAVIGGVFGQPDNRCSAQSNAQKYAALWAASKPQAE